MTYRPRYQWEDNSAPSQPWNCGPTCATAIAEDYEGVNFHIEVTRRTVTSCCHSTTYQQQAAMLTARGVPATLVNITSLKQLHALVDGGHRPVILAIYMARVPYSVRGHSFTKWHAIVCRDGAYKGTRGFWMNDPNFSPPGGSRPDPTGGKRFYSDAVVQSAFLNNYQHWAIVPNRPKTTTQYVKFNTGVNGVNLRTAPDARKANVYAVVWASPTDIRLGTSKTGKWIGNIEAKRTLYGVVSGYDYRGNRVNYNKLRLAGTGRYEYVDSRFMHRV